MPFWLIITGIVVFWLVALLAIIMFMMGASRGRARERANEERRVLQASAAGQEVSDHKGASQPL
ncbi:hypothetical protein [Arthrobacter sp. GMC3]|uniref:hypothetical protein n=1 Tax=Arthrobacter sp. GMC3 TaxID=2058894 RepID=UPI000CE3E853|nr:hypothetical protein [Arthrobacter sp. GMC3]